MKRITVCTVVFNRHDLLHKLVASLQDSTVRPERVIVIDHGFNEEKVREAVTGLISEPVEIVTLEDPGMAHAINWCLLNVPEERLICNDDIQFRPDVLGKLLATEGDFVAPYGRLATPEELNGFHPFSCFIMRDSCIEKVGFWDESISPRYLYFEDCDYSLRMLYAEVPITEVDCKVFHEHGSSSYSLYTPQQMEEHHAKFALASQNFCKKWGHPPSHNWEEEYRQLKEKKKKKAQQEQEMTA